MAWLPKATVQAAIGSVALDLVKESTSPKPEELILGQQILTMAVSWFFFFERICFFCSSES